VFLAVFDLTSKSLPRPKRLLAIPWDIALKSFDRKGLGWSRRWRWDPFLRLRFAIIVKALAITVT
jgi:hypothetical protein